MRTTERRAPGARDLPPRRRRRSSILALPAGLAGRLPGHPQRGTGGQHHHRQRGRQRGGRRQAHLHLRAGDGPVLPGGGPDPPERGDATGWKTRPAGTRPGRTWTGWSSSRSAAAAGTASSSGPRRPTRSWPMPGPQVEAGPPGVDRPGRGRLFRPGRPASATVWSPPLDLRPFAVNDGGSVGRARRPDPGGAPRGRPGRELQPGRRLQGHLGHARRSPLALTQAARPSTGPAGDRSPASPG